MIKEIPMFMYTLTLMLNHLTKARMIAEILWGIYFIT